MLCTCTHHSTVYTCYDNAVDWIRAHLTLVYGIGIGLLILTAMVLVSDKFATNVQDDAYTWGSYGGGGRFIPTEQYLGSSREAPPYEQPVTITEISRNLQMNPDRVYASLVPSASIPQGNLYFGTTTTEGALELGEDAVDALLKSIKPSAYTGNLTASEGTLDEIYHFIPKNIGSAGVSNQRQMNKTQRDLYNYGNEAGSSVELFSSIWAPVQANIHRSFVEDRANPDKAASLKKLGNALTEVGLSLSYMELIPLPMKTAHGNLAAAYQKVGGKTIAIADARADDELLAAIDLYNAAADDFLKAYLAVSTVFNLNSVSFSDVDPGRMFVYTASGL